MCIVFGLLLFYIIISLLFLYNLHYCSEYLRQFNYRTKVKIVIVHLKVFWLLILFVILPSVFDF